MNEGKLKERLIKFVAFDKEGRMIIDVIFNEAKEDILKKIKEYEDEDIPDNIMKEKIIEWFGGSDEEV